MEYQYWKHKLNQEIYAVELDEDGEPSGVVGPLNHDQVTKANLLKFVYGHEDVDYVTNNMHNFTFLEGK